MKSHKLQISLGRAQCSSIVRSIPLKGAVYPFHGPKQAVTFGPKVTQGYGAWLASQGFK